jgi:hypothetical protein
MLSRKRLLKLYLPERQRRQKQQQPPQRPAD